MNCLPDVVLPQKPTDKDLDTKFEILIDLWKLSEFRNYLKKDSDIEMTWLKNLQIDSNIKSKLNTIKAPSTHFLDFIKKGLEPNNIYSKDEITAEIYEQIAEYCI